VLVVDLFISCFLVSSYAPCNCRVRANFGRRVDIFEIMIKNRSLVFSKV